MSQSYIKFIKIFIFTTLTITFLGCEKKLGNHSNLLVKANVPTIDEVSGIWMASDTMAIEPSIRNFRGQALLNRDMTSVSWFVSAPRNVLEP